MRSVTRLCGMVLDDSAAGFAATMTGIFGGYAFEHSIWLIGIEDEIYSEFGCHPRDLTAGQLLGVFGVTVH